MRLEEQREPPGPSPNTLNGLVYALVWSLWHVVGCATRPTCFSSSEKTAHIRRYVAR